MRYKLTPAQHYLDLSRFKKVIFRYLFGHAEKHVLSKLDNFAVAEFFTLPANVLSW